jgi:hypothetical protein
MSRGEFGEIWARYSDGAASTQDVERLATLIERNPALLDECVFDSRIDCLLKQMDVGEQDFLRSFDQRLHAESDATRVVDAVREEIAAADATSRGGSRRRRVGRWAAAAACVALVAGAALYHGLQVEKPSGTAVAAVREASPGVKITRARDRRVEKAEAGMEIFEGDTIDADSGAHLTLGYPGEETTVKAGSSVRGTRLTVGAAGSGKRLHLDAGLIEAAAAPQPADRTMVVTTPHAMAEVRGTRFSMWDDGAATWLEVTEGEVTLTRVREDVSFRFGGNTLKLKHRPSERDSTAVGAGLLAAAGPGLPHPPRTYPAGAGYVDGPVIVNDDFEKDTGKWQVRANRPPGIKDHPEREKLTKLFDKAAAACVKVITVERDGKPTKVMSITGLKFGKNDYQVGFCLREPTDKERFSLAYDKFTVPNGRLKKRRGFTDTRGRWARFRAEIVEERLEDGKKGLRMRWLHGKKVLDSKVVRKDTDIDNIRRGYLSVLDHRIGQRYDNWAMHELIPVAPKGRR